ncbi:alpha/beta-hydrolase [Rhizoclosmatium globosum]|uniref:Carboxypeptidase n=1 Tax=Rhizoclosmatium globosum TaxID=329046 RepID=A0A1Y2CGP7_9FUNG|nr:alpha/beta-hydrolase [Rhizoclosmatium globosum]|eukprot:ORY46096.1 alpha/beta-hydrolase [Rhizoclosmatium globosum]
MSLHPETETTPLLKQEREAHERIHPQSKRWTLVQLICASIAVYSVVAGLLGLVSLYIHSRVGSAKDVFLVKNLPRETPEITAALNKHYAGYIPVTKDGSLFFWYFPSKNTTSDELVIWINGGPGCSSLIGQFTENGPFYVADDGSLYVNPNSWHKRANVLYVDQPIGAGFSFTKPKTGPHDEYEVGEQFYTLLRQWYGIFPEAQKLKLFITGESYAGVYVPWIGKYIIENPVLPSGKKVNLKALGVGNPVLHWKYQFDAVSAYDYLKDVNFFGDDKAALYEASQLAEQCRYTNPRNDKNRTGLPYECNMYEFANDWKVKHSNFKCLDRLNYHKECVPDELIGGPGLSVFLDDAEVRKAIHVDPFQTEHGGHIKWKACDNRMDNLDDSFLPEPIEIIPNIISSGVKYLVYEGDLDIQCS